MKRIYVVGTADTKGEELAYLAACIKRRAGALCASMSAHASLRPPSI